MSATIAASVFIIPIHDGMYLSIQDPEEGSVTKRRVRMIQECVAGCSFEEIEAELARGKSAGRVSVKRMVQE